MECTAAGFAIPAEYTCVDAGCDLRALCAAHVVLHRQWGHGVTVLVATGGAEDDYDVPGPDTLLGVTHCPKPEHSGAEGLLTHQCRPCKSLLCRQCADEHLGKDHTVWPLGRAAEEAHAAIDAAQPVLQAGLAHQVALSAQLRQQLATLAVNRESAVAALAASTARLHAQVDAQQAAVLAELDAAYNGKVAALESALKAARCSAGELVTVAAAVEAARGAGCSPTTRVHVAQSVAATLPLASAQPSVDVDVTLSFHGGVDLPAGAVGRLLTGDGVSKDGPIQRHTVSVDNLVFFHGEIRTFLCACGRLALSLRCDS